MASWRPEIHSAEDVIHYYDQFDESYFNLYAGARPEPPYLRWDYLGNDKSIGREKLADALRSIESNPDNNNTYLLQILMEDPAEVKPVPGRKPRVKKSVQSKNITFQLNKTVGLFPYPGVPGAMVGGMGGGSELKELLQQNRELIQLIKERLAGTGETVGGAMEMEQDHGLGMIGKLLETPALQPIIEVAAGALAGWLENQMATKKEPPAINGVPPGTETVLDILFSAGMNYNDLIKLSQIAERRPLQFKMYLSMLRSQKV